MFRFALASALATAEAGNLAVTYSDCGAKHATVTDLQPTTIHTGATETVTGTGTSDEDVTSAHFTATVSALGAQLTSCSGDGTKDIVCTLPMGVGKITVKALSFPIAKGTVSIPVEVQTSAAIPPSLANVDVHIAATEQNGESVICLDVHTAAQALSSSDPIDAAWETFKEMFPKTYNSDEEEEQRKVIFAGNMKRISEHNAGSEKYTLGVNQFADLTVEEWSATYKGAIPPASKHDLPYLGQVEEKLELASSMDWVSRGAVTPVKNQGQCGSCWSFSTTGAMEGSYQVATGSLVSLAEQQLVDCDTSDGNQGCSGGWPYLAMTFASQNGACQESSYPYRASQGSCRQSSCSLAFSAGTVTGYQSVGQTESGLMSALNGAPVSITVNAAGSAFQLYSGGVMTQGCTGEIDHAVLAVGYGTYTDGTQYWRVKNSWGTTWGDAGYFNLERGVGSYGALCVLQYPPSVPAIAGSVSV